MRIGLFGGSFNPPHLGHRSFASVFKAQASLDQIWIMVSPDPPHKEESELAPYEHRLNMARLNFKSLDGIVIHPLEESLPAPHFTVQTLREAQRLYPEHTFFLCVGEDSVQNFETWKAAEEILNMVELYAVKRGQSTQALPDIIQRHSDRLHWLEAEIIPISSSTIRKKLNERGDASEYLNDDVLTYIDEHKLYQH